MRIATLILHIRWRLARHRFASPALGCRLRASRTRERQAVERPSHYRHYIVRISSWMRASPNPRTMDAHCRDLSSSHGSLEDPDAARRQMALAVTGNRQCRSRDVRTRSMVDRRSPFRVEACRSSAPQTQFYPLLANYPNNRISWLKRGCYAPPKRFRFVPMWGCAQMEPGG